MTGFARMSAKALAPAKSHELHYSKLTSPNLACQSGVCVPERQNMQKQTYEKLHHTQDLKLPRNSRDKGPTSCAGARDNLPVSCSPITQPRHLTPAHDQVCLIASRAIHRGQIRNLMLALQFAIAEGIAPNRFLTINLEQGGRRGNAANLARQLLFKTQREWVNSRGGQFAAIWVREIGPTVGEHVHILLHVPANLQPEFAAKMRHWRRIIGPARGVGLVKTKTIRRTHHDGSEQSDSDRNLHAVLNYMLKGHDQASQQANLQLKRKDCGTVEGKRCGYTQNLGRSARRRNGRMA